MVSNSSGSQLTTIVGKWSADALWAPGPADEVMVFLPGGRGVLEVYNWALCWYETFAYIIHGHRLSIVGATRYGDNHLTQQIEQTPSHIQYTGQYAITARADVYGKVIDVLEFERPLHESALAKRFGRVLNDMAGYHYPAFEEWRK